jgi:hypothetical protein
MSLASVKLLKMLVVPPSSAIEVIVCKETRKLLSFVLSPVKARERKFSPRMVPIAMITCLSNVSRDFTNFTGGSAQPLTTSDGFILPTNRHDSTTMDHIILPMLTASSRDILEQHDYLGEYYLTSTGFCYRTQVAIRAMVTSSRRMQDFLANEYDGQTEESKIQKKTREICGQFREHVKENIRAMEQATMRSHVMQTLNARWTQLSAMLDQAEIAMFA